jgi:hypothetical protein
MHQVWSQREASDSTPHQTAVPALNNVLHVTRNKIWACVRTDMPPKERRQMVHSQ